MPYVILPKTFPPDKFICSKKSQIERLSKPTQMTALQCGTQRQMSPSKSDGYVWFQGYLILLDSSSLADSLSWAMLHSKVIPAKLLKVFPVEQAKSRQDRITYSKIFRYL